MKTKVELFVVGWPKTGSTSLDYYLGQHPDICMAKEKDSYFFCKDLIEEADNINKGSFYRTRTMKDYLKLFNDFSNQK